MKEDISIVIPVRNEESNIVVCLEAIKKTVKILHRVIVVDGCSTDKTVEFVSKYAKQNRNVKLIRTSPQTSGFKESIEIGIKKTRTEYLVVMMGDLCDDPKTISIMHQRVEDGNDIVVGSRYMKGGKKIGEPRLQGFFSRYVNKTLRLLTGIPTHDVSNPFKLYRKSLLTKIQTASKANEVPIEVMYKAFFGGARISEVPTTWVGRKAGRSKFKMWKVIPGYAKLYVWVVINSWVFHSRNLYNKLLAYHK